MFKNIFFILIALTIPLQSNSECRLVSKESSPGKLEAYFRCAQDEVLGAISLCTDEYGSIYLTRLVSLRKFKCINPTYYGIDLTEPDQYFCDNDNDPNDMSCLVPIRASFICCTQQ